MKRLRMLWIVLKRSGAERALIGFLIVFLVCALIIMLFDPGIESYGDALWYLWEVSTTVGLGDYTTVSTVARIVTVICSIVGIITTAAITGIIVDYFSEIRQSQLGESLSEFLDSLERLPELDHEELVHISERVKKFRKD